MGEGGRVTQGRPGPEAGWRGWSSSGTSTAGVQLRGRLTTTRVIAVTAVPPIALLRCVRHWANHFPYIIPFNPPSNPLRWIISLFYSSGYITCPNLQLG